MEECNHEWTLCKVPYKERFLYIFNITKVFTFHKCSLCRGVLVEHGTPDRLIIKAINSSP